MIPYTGRQDQGLPWSSHTGEKPEERGAGRPGGLQGHAQTNTTERNFFLCYIERPERCLRLKLQGSEGNGHRAF